MPRKRDLISARTIRARINLPRVFSNSVSFCSDLRTAISPAARMMRLVSILTMRCVKNCASRYHVSRAFAPRKSKQSDSPTNTTSRRFPLIFSFYASRLGSSSPSPLPALSPPPSISKHATRSVQRDVSKPEVLEINVKYVTMYSYYRRVPVPFREITVLVKIMTRRTG